MHKNKAMEALEKMFWLFPQSGDETERSVRFAVYWEILSQLPVDSVAKACALAARGKVGNPAFLPTAGELFAAAEKFAAQAAPGLPRLPEPRLELPAGERARRVAILQKLKSEIRAATAAMEAPFITKRRPGIASRDLSPAKSESRLRLSDEAMKIFEHGG
jgi:hypothetical protein